MRIILFNYYKRFGMNLIAQTILILFTSQITNTQPFYQKLQVIILATKNYKFIDAFGFL